MTIRGEALQDRVLYNRWFKGLSDTKADTKADVQRTSTKADMESDTKADKSVDPFGQGQSPYDKKSSPWRTPGRDQPKLFSWDRTLIALHGEHSEASSELRSVPPLDVPMHSILFQQETPFSNIAIMHREELEKAVRKENESTTQSTEGSIPVNQQRSLSSSAYSPSSKYQHTASQRAPSAGPMIKNRKISNKISNKISRKRVLDLVWYYLQVNNPEVLISLTEAIPDELICLLPDFTLKQPNTVGKKM